MFHPFKIVAVRFSRIRCYVGHRRIRFLQSVKRKAQIILHICPGYDDNVDSDGDGIPDGCDACCLGRAGDANGVGGDEPTIGDISVMIDAKFISGTCDGILNCLTEADINQSGSTNPTCDDVSIGDISVLIDYLFITGPTLGLPNCL